MAMFLSCKIGKHAEIEIVTTSKILEHQFVHKHTEAKISSS
jgi:hypothetical protein